MDTDMVVIDEDNDVDHAGGSCGYDYGDDDGGDYNGRTGDGNGNIAVVGDYDGDDDAGGGWRR